MKSTILFILFLILATAGGSWLYYYKSQIPDNDAISQDITERLLVIDGHDSNVSEFALRSRFNLDNNYDRLARSTSLLDKSIADMKNTYFKNSDTANNLLDKRFKEFRDEIEVKKDLVENFKSHNSVLRNSQKYAPAAGKELMAVAEKENLTDVVKLYSEVTNELLEYALLGSATNVERLKRLIPRMIEVEKLMPENSVTDSIEFINHVNTVIEEKSATDNYLSKALASTTDNSLTELSKAWKDWIIESNISNDNFNKYMVWYIGFLLLSIGIISWKLRSLYSSLDKQVIERTAEVEKAFEELKNSEAQLLQSEQMASLGKMAAGVADEINTPLDYVSSNVDTIRLNMGDLDSVLDSIAIISEELDKKPEDRKNISQIIKSMIVKYRTMRKRETFTEIEGLLKGSSYGLNEISDLVSSLKDFSRLDKADIKTANIHSNIDETIKICSDVLGNRSLIKNYSDELPLIECQPSKISQVIMNVITNAAQATDEKTGEIVIITECKDDQAIIVIKDNGKGMDQETLSQIFEPFYTTKEIGEGSGLGLSVSQKIMKSHGGSLSATSHEGEGTRVVIKLPILQSVPILKVVNK